MGEEKDKKTKRRQKEERNQKKITERDKIAQMSQKNMHLCGCVYMFNNAGKHKEAERKH